MSCSKNPNVVGPKRLGGATSVCLSVSGLLEEAEKEEDPIRQLRSRCAE